LRMHDDATEREFAGMAPRRVERYAPLEFGGTIAGVRGDGLSTNTNDKSGNSPPVDRGARIEALGMSRRIRRGIGASLRSRADAFRCAFEDAATAGRAEGLGKRGREARPRGSLAP